MDGEDKGRTEPVVTNGDLAGTDGDGEGRTEVSATNEEVANTDGKDEGRTEAGKTNEEPANTDGGWMNFARRFLIKGSDCFSGIFSVG